MSKIVIITGANTGIGYEATKQLAGKGYHVIMACRNVTKGTKAVQVIRSEIPSASLEVMETDLASFDSIKTFAEAFKATHTACNILINNAGIFVTDHQTTSDGIELQFGVNHLGAFLLTHLMLPLIKASTPARIINVSSIGHYTGKIHFDDLMLEAKYNGLEAYRQSKLANVLFTYELARRLEGSGVTSNCLHPGLIGTSIGSRNNHSWMGWVWRLYKPFMTSAKRGAFTMVKLASDDSLADTTGEYFDDDGEKKRSSELSHDLGISHKLWDVSEQLTGITFGHYPDTLIKD